MRRYAHKALFLAGAAALLTMGATSQALASWQASNDGQGFISAQACVGASNRCVRLQCLAMQGGGVYWYIDAPEPGYSAESTAVTWTIDNHRFAPLEMTKAGPAEGGVQSYETVFDQAKHQALVEALKAGNRLTVSGDQFAPITVSLRGSGNALTQALADCPRTNMAQKVKNTAPVQTTSINEPMDAVKVLMASQDCKATEEEIFGAITGAGFGIWDANQFIAMGAENGVLQLVDKTGGVHSYRLGGGCS